MRQVVVDIKCYVRRFRMGKAALGLDKRWASARSMALGGGQVDWKAVATTFRHGRLLARPKKAPLDSEDHRAIKGAYAFLQLGYVVRDSEGKIALFDRSKAESKGKGAPRRITAGHSILLGASPTRLKDHDPAIAKLKGFMERTVRFKGWNPKVRIQRVSPVGIGYADLLPTTKAGAPAYLWILHELVLADPMPADVRCDRGAPDRLVGFKDLKKIRRARIDNSPMQFRGRFDEAALRFFEGGGSGFVSLDGTTMLRGLSDEEKASYRRIVIVKKDEKIHSMLTSVGIAGAVGVQVYDWLDRVNFFDETVKPTVKGAWDGVRGWLEELSELQGKV